MKFARALALPIALAACAGTGDRCAALPQGQYCLQPSADVAPFEATQIVRLRIGERRETLVAALEVDADGLRMAGLTPLGQKLLQLDYDNRAASVQSPAGARIDAVQLAALLQLALWPAASVRAGLSPALALEDDGGARRIVGGGAPVVSIRREGDAPPYRSVQLSVPGADLEMTVETVDDAARAGETR